MNHLSSHILFKKYKKVQTLCLPLTKLGISGFIYMRRYPDGRFIDLSNQIEWTNYFLDKYLNEHYPTQTVENHMLSKQGTFLWSMEPENIVWKEGSKLFGFGNGISIYKKSSEYCEVFCFYGKSTDCFLDKVYVQSFPLLEKFAKYFTEHMSSDILSAYEKSDLLVTPEKYVHSEWKIITEEQEKEFVKDLEISSIPSVLSPREKECIFHSTSGKTAKEVARLVNLSPRTVEVHLANAKRKLGCRNFKELTYKFSSTLENIFGHSYVLQLEDF